MGRRRRNQSRQKPTVPTSLPPMDRRQIQPPLVPVTPTPPPPGDHDKACVVFSCLGKDTHKKMNVHYKLCVVDLSSDVVDGRFAPISPTLQINTGSSVFVIDHGFCVWNKKTLYVFEGCDRGVLTNAHKQKSIFTYDLDSLFQNSDSDSEKKKTMVYLHARDAPQSSSSLTKVTDMIYAKQGPSAVLTPDGNKILLLATHLDSQTIQNYGGMIELFDPVTKLSEPLPSIPGLGNTRDSSTWFARSHGFISKSEFVVSIPSLGHYIIDLEHERIWKYVRARSISTSIQNYRHKLVFSVVEDRFLFYPDAVRDISNEDVNSNIRIPSSFIESHVRDNKLPVFRVGGLTLLKHDKEKGECYFCVMHSLSRIDPSLFCHMSIDVCRAVYPKKGQEEKPVEVELVSWRRLKLSGEPDDYEISLFHPCFLFCI